MEARGNNIMELAKKIEEAFISQVREEEQRAKRTLRVLQHQQEQIGRLQRLQQVQQNSSGSNAANEGEDRVNKNPHDPMEHVRFDELWRRKKPTQESEQNIMNHSKKNSLHVPEPLELENIQKEMKYTKDVLLRSKTKIQTLEKAVCGLQCSGSEVNLLAEEMSGWRSTIDNALLTIESTTSENAGAEKRIWKIALEFFTPQEALHFLITENIGMGTMPKNHIY